MDSSKMDRLVTIQWPSPTRSATGQETITWVDLDPVWAELVPQTTGKEYFAAAQIVAELYAIFRIRYRADVSQKMRLLFGTQPYDIEDMREVERREGLALLCKVIRETD
jgi:SPP1 family predicted phage head-tail adaptor